MGHVDLACPTIHPWFFRIIPSRIAILLEMKSTDLSKICYFSAYVITHINEELRTGYLGRIEGESEARIKSTKMNYDKKFEDLGKQYQIDKSSGKFDADELRAKYEIDKEIIKTQQLEIITKIETIAQIAKKELIGLQVKDVISENIHQELAQKFGPVFKAEIGAEAIKTLLDSINLEEEQKDVKARMLVAKSQNLKKLSQKLKLIKYFIANDTKPSWMILNRVMILPPDLRPMLQLDGGRFAASDLNDLYRRLINRNNRLRKLIQISAPEVILRNEKRMLQEALEALIDNSARNGKQVMATSGAKRPLKSLTDSLKGKGGRFRQNLLGKRVDYSGRSVIIIGPNLKIDECGLPKEMALELFKPFLIGRIIAKSEKGLLSEEYQCYNIHSARRLIESKKPVIYDILDEVIKDKYVLLNRAPTLHRLGFLAFKPVLIEGKAIQIHPMVCRGFNADFDGDQMAVHLPITIKGQEEARDLMAANHNLLKPANGKLVMGGTQDLHLGAYYMTVILDENVENKNVRVFASQSEVIVAYQTGVIQVNELIKVRLSEKVEKGIYNTTAGRLIFNNCLPEKYPFINETITKSNYDKILGNIFHQLGREELTATLDKAKNVIFKYVTASGVSISIADFKKPAGKEKLVLDTETKVTQIQSSYDLGLLTESGKHSEIVELWRNTSTKILDIIKKDIDPTNNVGLMVTSGARGNAVQVNFMIGMRGLTVASDGQEIELATTNSYLDGFSPLEYFVTMRGHRKGMAGTALQTADAGYLTRRLVDVAQNLIVMDNDCGTVEGMTVSKLNSEKLNSNIYDRIYGRYALNDIVVKSKTIVPAGELITLGLLEQIKENDKDKSLDNVTVRNVIKCVLSRGVCQKCYGIDFSSHQIIQLGSAVGVIGAQSIGEPATQLAVGSVKHGVAIGAKSDITAGLPRVEELLEARTPRYLAPISSIDGTVTKIEGSVDAGFKISVTPDSNVQFLLTSKQLENYEAIDNGSQVSKGDIVAVSKTGTTIIANLDGQLDKTSTGLVISTKESKLEEFTSLPGSYIKVKVGQKVVKGFPLADGSVDLQALMDLAGIDSVQQYIISELNDIYQNNGIDVDEKHIEVIIKQMCNRVQIIDAGDSDMVAGDLLRLAIVKNLNLELAEQGLKPIKYKIIITGISRASLSTNSFLSAASFQETSRVLVEAALSSRKDYLVGLKENVILGQLIPCGTGFNYEKIQQLEEVTGEFDEVEVSRVIED
jgi:DNA-directed RNA polymerase subunit beta'